MKHLSHRPIRRRQVDIRYETRLILHSFLEWQDWLESTYSPLKDQELDILAYYYEPEYTTPYTLSITEQTAQIKLRCALKKIQFYRYKYELWLLHITNGIEIPLYNEEVLDVPVLELDLSRPLLKLFKRYQWNTMREAVAYSWNDLNAKGFTRNLFGEMKEVLNPVSNTTCLTEKTSTLFVMDKSKSVTKKTAQ